MLCRLLGAVRPKVSTVERRLAQLAARSHGVVTRRQLLDAGISADELKHRVGNGVLLRVHRGVYRVGHRAPSLEARYLAAVRACGEGAAELSGRAAAYLWALVRGPAPDPEVTTLWGRRVKGVITRRSRRMDPREQTVCRGIPLTTPAKTLVDLAAAVSEAELARACHEAAVRHHTTPKQVEAVLARRPNTTGAGDLRRVLRGEVRVTLSKLEQQFLERVRDAGLPLPQTNRSAGTHRVDCRWLMLAELRALLSA